MKQEISALMDNELDQIEANRVILRLHEDPDVRMAWSAYHLIGDVLRQEHVHRPALEGRILTRLSQEPTVLAPQRGGVVARLPRIALAAAASLAAVATVAWMATREPAREVPVVAQKQSPPVQQPVVAAPETPDVSEYFRAHQEYALAPAGAVLQAAFAADDSRDGSR
jgi:sigma-E factor negative regulatory protein RseA